MGVCGYARSDCTHPCLSHVQYMPPPTLVPQVVVAPLKKKIVQVYSVAEDKFTLLKQVDIPDVATSMVSGCGRS